MVLDKEETWPVPLLDYLSSQCEMLHAHARHDTERLKADRDQEGRYIPWAHRLTNPLSDDFDCATLVVRELVQSTVLRGWHCTRLTEHEVQHIRTHGMQLPNLEVLTQRVRRLQADGEINNGIAEQLIAKNQAGENIRQGRLFFCFFEPRTAGQSGIECFFRFWGGEALSNSHDHDPNTGKTLRKIGRPCLIQVDVPISSLRVNTSLGETIIKQYLFNRSEGNAAEEPDSHVFDPIPAANIVRFVFHGDPDFAALSGCDDWKPPL